MAERNIYRMRGKDDVDNNLYQVWSWVKIGESDWTIRTLKLDK